MSIQKTYLYSYSPIVLKLLYYLVLSSTNNLDVVTAKAKKLGVRSISQVCLIALSNIKCVFVLNSIGVSVLT